MEFSKFSNLIVNLSKEGSYINKTLLVEKYLSELAEYLMRRPEELKEESWKIFNIALKLLITKSDSRVYNVENVQLLNFFSKIFNLNAENLIEKMGLNGDASELITRELSFFHKDFDKHEEVVTLLDIDEFLTNLTLKNKNQLKIDLINHFYERVTCTDSSITFIRLMLKDLKNGCGTSHVLHALGPCANQIYQTCNDLSTTIMKLKSNAQFKSPIIKEFVNTLTIQLDQTTSTVISPMLAEAIKNFEKIYNKNKSLNVEIKYDGERVQIHKVNGKYSFYSRTLKPVSDHKVLGMSEELDKVFKVDNFILDSEILMINEAGEILPFGTLGKNKSKECLGSSIIFIFDCMKWDGELICDYDLDYRKSKLGDVCIGDLENFNIQSEDLFSKGIMTNSPRIRLSPHFKYNVGDDSHLKFLNIAQSIFQKEMEGLMLKPPLSKYEPGKRKWYKIKRDYIGEGKLADSIDLVILGCSYGNGKLASLYSKFLMGCWDVREKLWKTVTKVQSGLSADQITFLNKILADKVEKLEGEVNWAKISKPLLPKFIAKDPWQMPVLEIGSNEFSTSIVHSAKIDPESENGISLRFPRVYSIRQDKEAKDANTLESFISLYKNSLDTFNEKFNAFTNDLKLKGPKISKRVNKTREKSIKKRKLVEGIEVCKKFVKKNKKE